MQNQRTHTSYVPVIHCEKMGVTDVSFRQCAIIESLVKEGNSAEVMYERLLGVFGDAWMPHRPKRSRER
jgi:hypothetical protein